jgi:hypothetical protein
MTPTTEGTAMYPVNYQTIKVMHQERIHQAALIRQAATVKPGRRNGQRPWSALTQRSWHRQRPDPNPTATRSAPLPQ